MSDPKPIKSYVIEKLIDVSITSLGFFLAIFFNFLIEKHRDREAYKVQLSVVMTESSLDSEVLNICERRIGDSTKVVFPDPIFSTSKDLLSNKIFVENSDSILMYRIAYTNLRYQFFQKVKSVIELNRQKKFLTKIQSDSLDGIYISRLRILRTDFSDLSNACKQNLNDF